MSLVEIGRKVTLPAMGRIPQHAIFAALTAAMALSIIVGFALSVSGWTAGAFTALLCVAVTGVWISGGAATALMGLASQDTRSERVPDGWTPTGPTAILVMLCGEDPAPLARYLESLHRQFSVEGLDRATRIFVLSDTSGWEKILAEDDAFRDLVAEGKVIFRRRSANTGRKPGNIADWLASHGDGFEFMLVLDADSRMSASRIKRMIWLMERCPAIGLLQAGIALVPGTTRFGHHQRVAARLLQRTFGRGLAAWTGDWGNYWGHNAIMRVAAFRAAAKLPKLSGPAPFGGDLLSHDFIEAAWIRRAGWSVVLDPDTTGSAESAPQTLGAFHRRDRRWCQGNLQHLRLLGEPGLSPISRLHLVAGILSYIVAPAWLLIVVLIAFGVVPVSGVAPLLTALLVLAMPKLCALADGLRRMRTLHRRTVAAKAWLGEVLVSSIVAPLIMVRQVGAVASICLGQDCGWKTGRAQRSGLLHGLPEAGVGMALVAISWLANGSAVFWLAPVVLPLCVAPLIVRALDTEA